MIKTVLAASVAISFNVNAADTTYEFSAKTKDCISQLFENCPIIETNGLTGNFTVDIDALSDGNGIIAFNNFKAFEATNGLTAWNKNDLIEGAARFINYEVVEFNVKTKIDISNGWDVDTNGTGEELLIDNFGGIVGTADGTADSSVSSWDGTLYCVATDQFYPDTETCTGNFVVLNTYAIEAQYHKASINLKPGTIIDKGKAPEEVKVPIEMPAPAPTPAAPQASAEPQNEPEPNNPSEEATGEPAQETNAESVGTGSIWLFAPFLLGLITTVSRKVKIKC